ncbi:glycosyltransferase family 2 protein [Halopiger aswanensis]|uniref:Glycosyl transferase family 2 n=1 Tax=Halopiger aswanensis TaxID=148449 RepID=A0A3R7HHD8_9EURY|nr:glycosyltransferase family 2 protein [Halopiger aswanensis]RKD93665.1 glycosyl transferase family 2 [Halopiger aswanensis]
MLEFFFANPLSGALVAVLWVGLGLYGFSAGWWLLETLVFARGWRVADEDRPWGPDDVQVRILTVDAEPVVQATVNAVPDAIADVRVIAESELSIDGATVHVVPDEFDCTAVRKGRAVEWARQNVPCESEYVLYLDEDTIMTGFDGLPDADVVQFTEKPIYTGSRLAYLCELFRVGYQLEQLGFHRLRYPLYAWGGGIAVRASLEDAVTWDARTITEDTNFIWRAADAGDLSYRLLDTRFRNQAPPSVRQLIRQRRRWISGTIADGHILPRRYRPLYYTRVIVWGLSPLVPVVALAAYLAPGQLPTLEWYGSVAAVLAGILFVYMSGGLVAYRKHPLLWLPVLVLTPVAVVTHAIGALWGIFQPATTFDVTEKVVPERIETFHDELEPGELAAHDGTDRLLRESDEAFESSVFGD